MKEILFGILIIGGAALTLYLLFLFLGVTVIVFKNVFITNQYTTYNYDNIVDSGYESINYVVIIAIVLFICWVVGSSI